MDMKEVCTARHERFAGRLITVHEDEVCLPDGSHARREICEHPGGVGILPIDRDGSILLVRQFRYAFGQEILEIPAGKLDHGPDENPLECGKRELLEETGCTAGRIVPLGCLYPSPGFLTEVTHLFAALDLSYGQARPDEGELVELVRLSKDEVLRQVRENELRDAKTMVALYRATLLGLL